MSKVHSSLLKVGMGRCSRQSKYMSKVHSSLLKVGMGRCVDSQSTCPMYTVRLLKWVGHYAWVVPSQSALGRGHRSVVDSHSTCPMYTVRLLKCVWALVVLGVLCWGLHYVAVRRLFRISQVQSCLPTSNASAQNVNVSAHGQLGDIRLLVAVEMC
jgi:hypothetical protein